MLLTAISNRDRLQETENGAHVDLQKAVSFQSQKHENNDAQILKMRENHYQKKAAIREQQKFAKNMSKGEIGGKASAFETEYDFYFQNNQGMFVVQSQLK